MELLVFPEVFLPGFPYWINLYPPLVQAGLNRRLAVGRVGALACWEHVMNLARRSLVEDGEEIHAALWPALSTMAGFDQVADVQIEAMMRNHALTGQCFVVAASSPVTQEMLDFVARELGDQAMLWTGGGWSAVVHPFAALVAGPARGVEERLVAAAVDLDDIKDVKFWVDTAGHYARPDVLRLQINRRPQPTRVDMEPDGR